LARYDRFTFLINADERRMIALLSERLNRSRSDAIRFVIAQSIKALADPPPTNAARVADAQPALSRLCSICQSSASFPQRRRSRLHRGYPLATVMLTALLFAGSLLLFPEWTRTNGSVFVLFGIVVDRVIQFVANCRTAFSTQG